MAKMLPDEPERIRISRPGAPIVTDPDAMQRAKDAAISADRQSVPAAAPSLPAITMASPPVPAFVPLPVAPVSKPPKKKQVSLLCRVEEELGKRIKRIRVEYGLSEQAIISDALALYFSNREDSAIVAMLKAKGAGLRRVFE
jgi:hypothetical protein